MSLELPGEFKLSPGLTSDISLVRCSLQQRIPSINSKLRVLANLAHIASIVLYRFI